MSQSQSSAAADAAAAADTLARLRESRPAVQCVTNTVVMNLTANVLLAVGAVPSMSVAADEVGDFVASASALLINVGTIDPGRRAAIDIAISRAEELHRPWLLDPVMVDRAAGRLRFALDLLRRGPAVVRGNAAEIAALQAALFSGAHEPARNAAADLAASSATVVAQTGDPDRVVDAAGKEDCVYLGHELMTRVTGIGCAAGALVAACLAVSPPDAARAAARDGLLLLGVAGEIAASRARGPGSFAVELLDALYGLDAAAIHRAAQRPQARAARV